MRAGEYPWYAPEVYELWHPAFTWPKPHPPPPEVPDMIVFSDDDDDDEPVIDWDDIVDDWVDFLDWYDDFDPFEVLK